MLKQQAAVTPAALPKLLQATRSVLQLRQRLRQQCLQKPVVTFMLQQLLCSMQLQHNTSQVQQGSSNGSFAGAHLS